MLLYGLPPTYISPLTWRCLPSYAPMHTRSTAYRPQNHRAVFMVGYQVFGLRTGVNPNSFESILMWTLVIEPFSSFRERSLYPPLPFMWTLYSYVLSHIRTLFIKYTYPFISAPPPFYMYCTLHPLVIHTGISTCPITRLWSIFISR